MLALYSHWRSSASYRVRIALEIKGLSWELRRVHLARAGGEQHTPAYRAINPQGRVPSLVHDDRVITQSLAIIEYLDELHPTPPLLPAVPAQRARVRSLAQLIACDIQPLQNTATTRYLRQVLGVAQPAVDSWLKEWVTRGFEALELRLTRESGTGRFTHGDALSLADCCLVPQCYAARRFGVDPADFPNISRIERACGEIEAFRRAAPDNQADRE